VNTKSDRQVGRQAGKRQTKSFDRSRETHQREIKGSPVLCGEVGLSDVCSSCPRFARKNVAFLRFQNGHGEECAAKYMAHQKQYYKGRYHSAVARKPVYREEAVQSDQFERNCRVVEVSGMEWVQK